MKLGKLKVVQLRKELDARGLDSSGTRPILMRRLRTAMDSEVSAPVDSNARSVDASHQTTAPPVGPTSEVEVQHEAPRSEEPDKKYVSPEAEPRDPIMPVSKSEQEADVVQNDISAQGRGEGDDLNVEEAVVTKPPAATGSLATASQTSFDERMRLRRERFGAVPVNVRKQPKVLEKPLKIAKENEILRRRALKFGLAAEKRNPSNLSADEIERRLKRQRRFQSTGSTAV